MSDAPSLDARYLRDQLALLNPRLRYDRSQDAKLLGRHLLNMVLVVLTLTLYRSWALTQMRRMVWPNTRFDGEPFEYTGDALEIFIGFLKVVAIVLLPLGLLFMGIDQAFYGDTPVLISFAQTVIILILLDIGWFLSIRYRVSRTRWRGIRGRIDATVREYIPIAIWCSGLMLITAFLLKPVTDAARLKFLFEHVRLGSLKYEQIESQNIFFGRWLMVLLIGILAIFIANGIFKNIFAPFLFFNPVATSVILGLMSLSVATFIFRLVCWHQAAFLQSLAENSKLGPLTFRFHADGSRLFALRFGNIIIMLFTLGLGAPIVWRRRIMFFARYLEIIGEVEPETLRQIAEDEGGTAGDGLTGDMAVV